MKTLNISEARNTLPALVEAVSGTRVPVVLLRYGKPAAMLVPVVSQKAEADSYPLRKVPISIAKDFDEPSPELWEACKVAEKAGTYGVTEKHSGKVRRKRGKA